MANIIIYFVARPAADGFEAWDFKSINSSIINLFQCGHIQQIQVAFSQQHLFLSANCLPEDRVYKVIISLITTTSDILSAVCSCSGGYAAVSSCKHIAALRHAF